MASVNLWGDLSSLERVRTPKDILQEQADLLTQATKGVLIGCLEQGTYNPYDAQFTYDLCVRVPALNNYVLTLATISFDVSFYPVFLMVNRSTPPVRCETEEHFVDQLGKVLSSNKVKQMLSHLLSQAT